jgi:hypothetical protein
MAGSMPLHQWNRMAGLWFYGGYWRHLAVWTRIASAVQRLTSQHHTNDAGTPISVEGGFPRADTESIVLDQKNDILYVADFFGGSIYIIDPKTGKQMPGSPIVLNVRPQDIEIDEANDTLYVGITDGSVIPLQPRLDEVHIDLPKPNESVPAGEARFSGTGQPGAMVRLQVVPEDRPRHLVFPPAACDEKGRWVLTGSLHSSGTYAAVARQFMGSVETSRSTVRFNVSQGHPGESRQPVDVVTRPRTSGAVALMPWFRRCRDPHPPCCFPLARLTSGVPCR